MAIFLASGVAVLEPAEAEIFDALDARFSRIAGQLGARPVVSPALLPAGLLAELDFFANFPHLALPVATYTEETTTRLAGQERGAPAPEDALRPTDCLLPTATCYGMLMSLRRQQAQSPRLLTAIGRCHRNEEIYDGLRRLRTFHMREVLYVGDQEGAVEHLRKAEEQVRDLAAGLGIELDAQPATDPFYLGDGSRSLLSRLDPVKFEFVASDGTAIASVNRHRNFFGERLGIEHGDAPAYSSCLAFGVERWIHTLIRTHGGAERALDVVHGSIG
ncbi:aminoacyl--tRNA ligase-related protein [Nonomuraea sp. JJY05]|uniref:aminoacyl--tRNA ligase-related protein n=1 Tax=Nonomuraea sp. JJY05 TaxID=3350255 RepID=UPI00373DED97